MPIMNAHEVYESTDRDTRQRNASRLMEAVISCSERRDLTCEDFYALAAFLTYAQQDEDGRPLYAAVVDYLWMSFRIDFNTKCALLALLDE